MPQKRQRTPSRDDAIEEHNTSPPKRPLTVQSQTARDRGRQPEKDRSSIVLHVSSSPPSLCRTDASHVESTSTSCTSVELHIAVVKKATHPRDIHPKIAGEMEPKRVSEECMVVDNGRTRFGNAEGLSPLEEVRHLADQVRTLQAECKTIMLVNKIITLPIRVRFFRVFERDHMGIFPVNVEPGNEAAHHASLAVDVLVFKQAAVDMNEDDYRAFELIYGFSVANASKFTDDSWVCEVLDHMATHVVRGQTAATFEQLRRTFLMALDLASEDDRRKEDGVLRKIGKRVAGVLFAPFRSLQWPTVAAMGFYDKELPSHTFKVTARDGVQTSMQMWEPDRRRTKPPRVNVLLVPGAAVDHQIFALPTIEQNVVEYLQKAGYQLYCITHRIGKTIVAQEGHTTYDARLDIEAALCEIRRQQGSDEKIYVVAHCAGSVRLSMGLLDGTIPGEWIKGITASNVFMNPKFGKVNYHIARLPLSMTDIYRTFIGNCFACASSPQDAYLQQALNQATRSYPVGGKDEICNSVTCHRSELVFGRLWTHKKLNEATHANLSKFLGGTSMPCLEHLMDMGIAMEAINNDQKSLVNSHNGRSARRHTHSPLLWIRERRLHARVDGQVLLGAARPAGRRQLRARRL